MKYLAWSLLGIALYVGGVWASIWCLTNNHLGYVLISINGVWTGIVMTRNGWGHYKLHGAIDNLSLVIKQKPNLSYPYYERAQCYYMIGKLDLSLADLEMCTMLSDNPGLLESVKQIKVDISSQKQKKKK